LRLLGVIHSRYGSLAVVGQVIRLNVYLQAVSGFQRHSEVADGASAQLAEILQCNAGHARTAIGVMSLPRGASVEIDMTVRLRKQ